MLLRREYGSCSSYEAEREDVGRQREERGRREGLREWEGGEVQVKGGGCLIRIFGWGFRLIDRFVTLLFILRPIF